jgi:uncharacterized protein DUF2637
MSDTELSRPGAVAGTAELPCPPAANNTADTAIRASTAAVVLAVAGIAAYISYWHAYAVVRQYGEGGVTALLEPGTIDGLVYASSMVILHAARHRLPVPQLARAMLALGIAASLAVNVAQGWSHGLVGAAAAAWPAVALVGSYELLAWMIRTTAGGRPDCVPSPDHAVPQADQPGTIRQPAGEAVPATAPRDSADLGPASVPRFPVACTAGQVRGPEPGGPGYTDQADQADHEGGPVREGPRPREPAELAAPGPTDATAAAGDIDADAVAAYRASLAGGKPLSERKLAAAFGKTSRRWARKRIAEARQGSAAGLTGRVLAGAQGS